MEVRVYSSNSNKSNTGTMKRTAGSSSKTRITKDDKNKKSSKTLEKPASSKIEKEEPKDGLDLYLATNNQQNLNTDLESMLKAMDPIAVAKDKASKEINFIFDPKAYDGEIHYSRDGNSAFYTQENEKKRAELKTNQMVEEAINRALEVYKFEKDGTLSKAEYIRVNTGIAKILRQDLKEANIIRLLEEDWMKDCNSKGYMEKRDVYDSLFELGDTWTPDIDAYQMVTFFEKIAKLLKGEEELPHLSKSKVSVNAI